MVEKCLCQKDPYLTKFLDAKCYTFTFLTMSVASLTNMRYVFITSAFCWLLHSTCWSIFQSPVWSFNEGWNWTVYRLPLGNELISSLSTCDRTDSATIMLNFRRGEGVITDPIRIARNQIETFVVGLPLLSVPKYNNGESFLCNCWGVPLNIG